MISPKKEDEAFWMDQERMQQIVLDFCGNGQAEENAVQCEFDGAPLMVVSDVQHDRMRIISPIMEAGALTEEVKTRMLLANFHSALDARYAIGSGVLYAAFIHPLSKLDKNQIESAVRQVATLRNTFGSDFTSGDLEFTGRREEE